MPLASDPLTTTAVAYQYSVLIGMLDEIERLADRQGHQTVARLAVDARGMLEGGGLTPPRIWLGRLAELSPEELDEVDPLWLRKSYRELDPREQALWLRQLRAKGWTFQRLHEALGPTQSRMHQLLRRLREEERKG